MTRLRRRRSPTQKMNRLIDTCVAPRVGNVPQETYPTTESTPNNCQPGWSSWVSRQITAAYDEHATIIGSLREELNAAKNREKALISEFTDRFRKMQEAVPGTNKTIGEMCPAHNHTIDNICYNDHDDYDDEDDHDDDDDEMPMDERAEASRIGNCAPKLRRNERRINDKFEGQIYREMENMRKENEEKILTIENALKEKVYEIERLKNKSYGQCIDQHGGGKSGNALQINSQNRSRSRSPGPPLSPMSSPKPSRYPINENFPFQSPNFSIPHSLSNAPLKIQTSRHPRTSERSVTPINRMRKGGGNVIISTPKSPRSFTGKVIDTIHHVHTSGALNNNFELSLDSHTNTDTNWELEASQMALDGSAIDNEIASLHQAHPPIPGMDTISPMSIPNNIQHRHAGQHNETHTVQKLLTAIDTHILKQKPADGQSIQLTDEELKFVERIKSIIHSSQKKQKHTISNLRKGLEGTTKETVKLNEELNEHEEYIKELEKQLNSANDSLRNTTDLEDMLRMLGGDNQKEAEVEHLNLKQKLVEAEQARDTLLRQMDALDNDDSDKSVRAFERVLADVTTEKNEAVGELIIQIDQLKDENSRLKENIESNDSPDAEMWSNKEERESKAVTKLEKVVLDLRKQMEDKDNYCRDLLSKVECQQKTIINLKSDRAGVESRLRDCTKREENFERKIRDLSYQTEDIKKQAATAAEALKTAKGAHIREHKLEDELSELRSLLDKTIEGKDQLRSEIHAKSEAVSKLKEQHAQDLKELQIEVSRLDQEKALLEQRSQAANGKPYNVDGYLTLQGKLRNDLCCNKVIRKNLHEQQSIHDKLRLVSNWSSNKELLDHLSTSMSSLLRVLESSSSPKSVANNEIFNYDYSGKATSRVHILEENLKLLRIENEKIREDTSERDQELVLLNTEMDQIKERHSTKTEHLERKEEELRALKESLNENSICYISGDESDSDDENSIASKGGAITIHAPMVTRKNSYDKELCANLINAKEEAEERAKSNGESLANAKMIITSLEQSNKKMTEDLRSRLHDSNAALVSILEQSQKHERESVVLQGEIEKLRRSKQNIDAIDECGGENDCQNEI